MTVPRKYPPVQSAHIWGKKIYVPYLLQDFLIRRNAHERSIHNAIQDSTVSSMGEGDTGNSCLSGPGIINLDRPDLHITKRFDEFKAPNG